MENELQATKEYLQTTVEELEASNEELKSTNEELQSTNEELQSTNEELETAKEELQSTNEELVTVNSELNNKIDELTEVNNDINNLLASTEIGTLFLDRELRIRRFTPAATKLFNLISQDVGRSIRDIAPKTGNENLWQDAEQVLHTLQVKELELKSYTGETYAARLLPYRTRGNVIDGVVLTFIDISAPAPLGDGEELRREHRQHSAGATFGSERQSSGNPGQPAFLQYIRHHQKGYGKPPGLRAGKRPVEHSQAQRTSGRNYPQERRVHRF